MLDNLLYTFGIYAFLRAPFLEENFVEWLNTVPISLKVDFLLPRGYGEKLLLRKALLYLGAPKEVASSPKQAMQFGSVRNNYFNILNLFLKI